MRVVATWLDGFDMEAAERWELPTLARLRETSAHAELDNGIAHLTGLSGEHLATGLDPDAADRHSAVSFDTSDYSIIQDGALRPVVFGGVDTVVLDPCYFDLDGSSGRVRGVVDWGAHDPGGPRQSRPDDLLGEVEERFGVYPAKRWIYGTPWASPELCTTMGKELAGAVRTRGEIARWLIGERLPDWDLAFVGVSEAHSASEGLFHGADPAHPLGDLPSTPAAEAAIRGVYEEIDGFVASLLEAAADAVHVVFTMHGMGANQSDVASMVLIGELMRRWSGDRTPDIDWPTDSNGVPQLEPGESWGGRVNTALGNTAPLLTRMHKRLPRSAQKWLTAAGLDPAATQRAPHHLHWMPLMRHQPHWSKMRAFAVPSFYDGRIRLNLAGREAAGMVQPGDYERVLDEIETMLRECTDPRTGEPVIAEIERPLADPLQAGPTEVDLVIHWAGVPLGLDHPTLGRIGPFPPRRTGGHTSPHGACFVHGAGIDAVDLGRRSSFDVIPTVFELVDQTPPWELSGSAIGVPIAT